MKLADLIGGVGMMAVMIGGTGAGALAVLQLDAWRYFAAGAIVGLGLVVWAAAAVKSRAGTGQENAGG